MLKEKPFITFFVQSFIVELQPCVQDMILLIVGPPFVELIFFSFNPQNYTLSSCPMKPKHFLFC